MAQESPPPGGQISSIEINGLKKTKLPVARYPLEKFIGRDAETLDLNEVEAVIRDMGILEPEAVELADDGGGGRILRIRVREKWSLIPFPVISLGSGEMSFGLFVLDTNAFGLRDQAAAGGLYSPSGWMVMGMYNYTPDRSGGLGWSAGGIYNRWEREDVDRHDRVYRRYTTDTLRVFPGLRYSFTDHLSGKFGVSFTTITVQEKVLKAPDNAMVLGFSPGLSLRYSHWDGFLLSEQSASLEYTFNAGLRGPSFHTVELGGRYEKSLLPGFRLNLQTGAAWTDSSDPLFEQNPKGADILPRNFSARYYGSFSGGLEKYLVKFRFGTISLLGSWQIVYSHGPVLGEGVDHGPSGGLRFYLSRLAVPALGIGAAYNINSGLFQFAFNLGMGF
jgi:hypothetical protein